MTMPRVLISDKLSPRAVEIFERKGVEVDVKTGLDPEELKSIIGDYDGLAVRSATKPNADILAAADNLKVIGRAGIGVDNIDIAAATARGICVMNTPFGNSITTAEHAIALMFALARQVPQANESTHQGKWEKSRFMGVELHNKVLGLIGCGNIGSIVASKAVGMGMKVIAHDPYLSVDRATELGVEKVELDDLLARADVISLHTPLTDATRNILSADALAKTRPGVRIVNCARGGLIDEDALKTHLDSGHIGGAALDVYASEPAREHPLFGNDKVICTPHLGASTSEAQENVALQVAEQMADFLLTGAVTNALNMPSVSAEEAKRLKPYMDLAEQLGGFMGQVVGSSLKSIEVEYSGAAAKLNTKPLTAIILKAVLGPAMDSVNMVNAPVIAAERDIEVSETTCATGRNYISTIALKIRTEATSRTITGTLLAEKPRIVDLDGVHLEAGVSPHMLYVQNEDKPGLIGDLGTMLAGGGINIASFDLGRVGAGDKAVCLVSVDQPIDDTLFDQIASLNSVQIARRLQF
ncbi:MAG: phosphoglycerate dehydrogenase [Alphaproteobacteria bacterium]